VLCEVRGHFGFTGRPVVTSGRVRHFTLVLLQNYKPCHIGRFNPPATTRTHKLHRRVRGLLGTNACYELRIEATDRLLLSARRRAKNKCSSYLIALSEVAAGEVLPADAQAVAKVGWLTPTTASTTEVGRWSRENAQCGPHRRLVDSNPPQPCLLPLQQLKSNLLGTEYTTWRKGGGPDVHKGYGAQALMARYQPTSASATGGARSMAAILPVPGAHAVFCVSVGDWFGWQLELKTNRRQEQAAVMSNPPSTELHPHTGEALWLPQGGTSDAPDALGPLLDRAQRHELSPAMERRVMLLHNMTPFYDAAKAGACVLSGLDLCRWAASYRYCHVGSNKPPGRQALHTCRHTPTNPHRKSTTWTFAAASRAAAPKTSSWCTGITTQTRWAPTWRCSLASAAGRSLRWTLRGRCRRCRRLR